MRFIRSRGLPRHPALCALGCPRRGVVLAAGSGGRFLCGDCASTTDVNLLLFPRGGGVS